MKLTAALLAASTIALSTLPANAQLSTDYSTSVIVLTSDVDAKCYGKAGCNYSVVGTIRNNTPGQVVGVSVEVGSDYNGTTRSISTMYALPARIMPGGTGNFNIPLTVEPGDNTRIISVTWYTANNQYQGYQPAFLIGNYHCGNNICTNIYR